MYGPGQQLYRIIPKTILCALTGQKLKLDGGGLSTRSFIHIRDVAESVYLIAMQGRAGDDYHTSTEQQTSIRALVELVLKLMGARFEDVVELGPERLGKDMAYQLDSSKIRTELGWQEHVQLTDGVSEVIRWMVDNFEHLKSQESNYVHKP